MPETQEMRVHRHGGLQSMVSQSLMQQSTHTQTYNLKSISPLCSIKHVILNCPWDHGLPALHPLLLNIEETNWVPDLLLLKKTDSPKIYFTRLLYYTHIAYHTHIHKFISDKTLKTSHIKNWKFLWHVQFF